MRVATKWGVAVIGMLLPRWLLVANLLFDSGSQENEPSVKLQTITKFELEQNANDSITSDAETLLLDFSLPKHCKQKLLFVASGAESLSQAEVFRSRFENDSRLSSLPICIFDVTWQVQSDLSCNENWQQSGRLGCQMLPLAAKLKSIAFTHLVVFAEKGKANVHNGIMFLDNQDSYDVFIHELAHFSGFIDEYPLSQGLAKRVCQGVEAPNMVFQKNKNVAADQKYWQSLGLKNIPEIHAARTCDNHPAQAFKASSKLTFMEYHDTAYIPDYYLATWQKQLQHIPNQPSAHINFAQLYEDVNNSSEGQFWRAKYQQYLNGNSPSKRSF